MSDEPKRPKNRRRTARRSASFVRVIPPAVAESVTKAIAELEARSPLAQNGRVHFRRCHLCSGVSENEETPVDKCLHCGKPMAPFYFFNDLEVAPQSDFELRETTEGEFRRPLRGFTAQW